MPNLTDVIKYEGDSKTLVWKHPVEDFNWGSQLIVHESQEAIFFRDGQALDLFGPGRYTLETQKLPLLNKLFQLSGGDSAFHSEVYFINLATQMGVKWGTDSKVRLFDPASGLHVEIGASGEFNIRVADSRKLLLKLVGTAGGLVQADLLEDGGAFRALVMTQVKTYLAQTIKENGLNILEIDAHLLELSNALRDNINVGLEEYGLTMPEFYVSRIVTPDDDPSFQRMKEQYAQEYLLVRQEQIKKSEAEAAAQRKAVEAQTEARVKVIGAQGDAEAMKLHKAAEAEGLKLQAAAEAEAMRLKGYTYQQETARQVGMEAMKHGLTGEGGGSALGDVAGLGVALGAVSGIAGMTKEALDPALGAVVPAAGTWDCVCGRKGLDSKFCPECGAKRPEGAAAWDCPCGQKGVTSKFCPECGRQKEA